MPTVNDVASPRTMSQTRGTAVGSLADIAGVDEARQFFKKLEDGRRRLEERAARKYGSAGGTEMRIGSRP
jgi:hypothetical protein